MSNRQTWTTGITLAAVAFVGACADAPTEPVEQNADEGEVVAAPLSNLIYGGSRDQIYAQIEAEVPGYGGHFYGENGEFNVYMADSPLTNAAAIAALAPRVATLGVDLSNERVVVIPAKYTFAELNALRSRADAVLGITGVSYTDADEALNRVSIGVESSGAIRTVQRSLGMAGVPLEAVAFHVVEPIVPMQSLQSRVRPLAGGLQINFLRGASGFLCTLGFNVREADGTMGFMTNSHCTDTRGIDLDTPYWQHSRFVADTYIGEEHNDPAFFVGGICPAGRVCRYSDAAHVRYEAPPAAQVGVGPMVDPADIAFGEMYRTQALGSIQIDAANPRRTITAERPFANVGQTLHKVGRTTGWTMGTVSGSCTNSNVANSNITMFCQDRVTGVGTIVAGGDSGSPVWEPHPRGGPNDVRLYGLLWGSSGASQFVMSAMNEIRFEVQPSTWTVYPGQ